MEFSVHSFEFTVDEARSVSQRMKPHAKGTDVAEIVRRHRKAVNCRR
jgi:hypothetical protein